MLKVNFAISPKDPWSKYVRMTVGSKQQNCNDSNSKSNFQAGEKYPGSVKFLPEHPGQSCGLLRVCLEQGRRRVVIKQSVLI